MTMNKLIAEIDPNMHKIDITSSHPYKRLGYAWKEKELQYHSSHDWLIPVIRKVKALPNSADWDGWDRLNNQLLRCDEPKYLFRCLVEFIQWYNSIN
jgi:hypothetical protein